MTQVFNILVEKLVFGLLVVRLAQARTGGALRQLVLGDAGDALEVVVARVAEVRRAETEEHRHLQYTTHTTSYVSSPQIMNGES